MKQKPSQLEAALEDWRQKWLPEIPDSSPEYFATHLNSVSLGWSRTKHLKIIRILLESWFTNMYLVVVVVVVFVHDWLLLSLCFTSLLVSVFRSLPEIDSWLFYCWNDSCSCYWWLGWRSLQNSLQSLAVFCCWDSAGSFGHRSLWWKDVAWLQSNWKSIVSNYMRNQTGDVFERGKNREAKKKGRGNGNEMNEMTHHRYIFYGVASSYTILMIVLLYLYTFLISQCCSSILIVMSSMKRWHLSFDIWMMPRIEIEEITWYSETTLKQSTSSVTSLFT